jgi:iron complex transport system substrate-binding protein
MRVFASVSAISLALASPVEAAPGRVASLKLCTDELLLMLADPAQIASVTHLSQNPYEHAGWRSARRYPRNDGTLISVTWVRPDLVLDMGGGGRDTARIAERLGIRLINLPYPQRLADIEQAVRTVAKVLGRTQAGALALARIDALKRSAAISPVEAVWLGGGGRSLPAQGLGAEWMALAGLEQRPLKGDRITLEQLLMRPPPVLLRSDYRQGQYSGEQRWLRHPLARGTARSRTVTTDGRPWTCMGPLMVDEVIRLRREVGR